MKKNTAKKQTENSKNTPQEYASLENILGAVLLLNTKSPTNRYLFSKEYEWLVIPAIITKQFILLRNKNNEPLAFISFAYVNQEVEKRLLSGIIKLSPAEWQCGNILYIIDIVSPFTPVANILKIIHDERFKDKEVKILRPSKDKKAMEAALLSEVINIKNK
jgi:cytolysin-activating lysine-acyltransferase